MKYTLRGLCLFILLGLMVLSNILGWIAVEYEKQRAERWRQRCGSLEDTLVQEGWKITWPTTKLGEWVVVEKGRKSYINQRGFAEPSLKD
jgi:hypothetical protein